MGSLGLCRVIRFSVKRFGFRVSSSRFGAADLGCCWAQGLGFGWVRGLGFSFQVYIRFRIEACTA